MFEPLSSTRKSTTPSNNFEANTVEKMRMENLKKEKERRENERYKMEYDAKKREFDMHTANKARFELEKRRYDIELTKYKNDTLLTLRDEKRYDIEKMHLTDEESAVTRKIQSMEVELQQLKNKAQKLKQDKEISSRKDKELLSDITKKNAYIQSIELKLAATERNLADAQRHVTTLNTDLIKLKKYA
ncbi:hypothetical protein H7Y21_03735 [Arenimonas sp.]|nr:hypothetical protein [Candidatus Parcubacteria bacterium]